MLKNKRIIYSLIIMLTIGITLFLPNMVQASNDVIVMLDPGHGGNEPGAGGGRLS